MNENVQRVGVGVGAFHNPPRAKYSEETRNLIKLLMEESKLSMMQRKSIQNAVDRGESLPQHPSRPRRIISPDNSRVIFPCYWKRRTQNAIASSGAYDREQYRRTAPLPNKEMQKRHLACMMAYGKDMPPTPHGPKILHKTRNNFASLEKEVDPIDDLVQGIRERIEFLNDMENLGQGKKYRPMMHQEIAQKIRSIEALDHDKSAEINKEMERFKYQLPPPKPFPMGELEDS